MKDSQRGLYSMFNRGYNFLRRNASGLLGMGTLAAILLGTAPDAQAQEGPVDIEEFVEEIDAKSADEEGQEEQVTEADIQSENQKVFAEEYEKMRAEHGKEPEKGYFIEGRARGSTNIDTEYDSWTASLILGKYAWADDRWNGRFRLDFDDTDGREEKFEISGQLDYKLSDFLTAGFTGFGGNRTAGGEGRIRIDLGRERGLSGRLFARGGGRYLNDRITDINTTGLLDSDQEVREAYGELGLRLTTSKGLYLSISDVFKWINTDLQPNLMSSVSADMDIETNAFIGSLGLRKEDYSLDLTGIWTHTRTKDNLAMIDSVERDDTFRGQATGFYHFRNKNDNHSIGLMVGGDKNGWDVRGIYIFQEGSSSIAKEIERLKTEKDLITRQEIQDRLEALSSVSLWVHKLELGGRRSEVPGARGWEAFGNYSLSVSVNSKVVDQLRLDLEGTYGEMNPSYGGNDRYFRGGFNAETRFDDGWYMFARGTGTARKDRRPAWTGEAGFGKRF